MNPGSAHSPLRDVLVAFTRLGFTAFGGPVAHVAHFQREFVERRRWLDATEFGHLAALCQTLPGPASSQLGFAIGLKRAGWPGAIAAFVAFTLPSAVLLLVLASGAAWLETEPGALVGHGLKLVTVSVVAHGVVQLARRLTPDLARGAIGIAALTLLIAVGEAWIQLVVLAGGAAAGALFLRGQGNRSGSVGGLPSIGPRTGRLALVTFALGLGAALLWSGDEPTVGALFAAFWRAGSLVFGGGHVVVPLLEESIVATGWVGSEAFLTAYGAAQAIPGPLFSVAALLGAQAPTGAPPALGALVAILGIFVPGFLILVAALPVWTRLGTAPGAAEAMAGIGATVVGLLAAAFLDPVLSAGVRGPTDALIAAGGLAILLRGRNALWSVGWCVAGALAAGLLGG